MDCALQEEAQEGSRGRSQKEKNTANCKISESCSRSNAGDHIGQEKPKARGPEGTERATDKVWIWGTHVHSRMHTHGRTHKQCAHSIASTSVYLQQSLVKLLFSCRAAKEKAKHKEAQKAAKVRKRVVVWLGGVVSQLPTPADAL